MESNLRLGRTPSTTWAYRALNELFNRGLFDPRDGHRALHAPRWAAPAGSFADARDPRYDWLSRTPRVRPL